MHDLGDFTGQELSKMVFVAGVFLGVVEGRFLVASSRGIGRERERERAIMADFLSSFPRL